MVAKSLTDQMIKAGAALVDSLDKRGLSPDAALWLYLPDQEQWRLVLAEVKLSRQGPRVLYQIINEALRAGEAESQDLSLDAIGLARPDSPLIQLLLSAIRTDRGISGIRFTNNVINGTVIDDAYIYRLTTPATKSRPTNAGE